jgi:hypothetical protein
MAHHCSDLDDLQVYLLDLFKCQPKDCTTDYPCVVCGETQSIDVYQDVSKHCPLITLQAGKNLERAGTAATGRVPDCPTGHMRS